jgi:hypothetical protein
MGNAMSDRFWDPAGAARPRRGARLAATIAGAILGLVIQAGCSDLHVDPLPTTGSSADDPVVVMPSLRRDIQPIFTARCAVAGCHVTATEANLGLVLKDADASYAHLVNVDSVEQPGFKRVVPGDALMSYLMLKLDAGEMPKQGPPLSEGTRDTIRNWINEGAPNN